MTWQSVLSKSLLLLFVLSSQTVIAAINFPALSGRVVDQAGLISAQMQAKLTASLAEHEKQTSNQVVVVTLKSLQGQSIEDYGYQLGRHWGIGQKDRNNGVLLIVAPNERKVRIEVGYGLEGTLTDALSKNIIDTQITPMFKVKNMEGGIVNGTNAILGSINGTYKPDLSKTGSASLFDKPFIMFFILFFIVRPLGSFIDTAWLRGAVMSALMGAIAMFFMSFWIAVVVAVVAFIIGLLPVGSLSSHSGSGYGGGGFGGGGFSGGGGSFGGGGASGSW